MKKFLLNFLLLVLVLFCVTGCVAANQKKMTLHSWSWKTYSYSEHEYVAVDGPIRWYEYCPYNNWIMTGFKPYGILGAVYLAFHPSDWFWYGHTGSNKYKYECTFKEGCKECEKVKLREIENYKKWYSNKEERDQKMLNRYGTIDLMIPPKE